MKLQTKIKQNRKEYLTELIKLPSKLRFEIYLISLLFTLFFISAPVAIIINLYLFVDYFWDRIKKDRNIKKAIYLDEIWRLIGVTSNKEVAKFIYKIFKTIRKYGGSAVAITQDISDLFSLENGTYGKSK